MKILTAKEAVDEIRNGATIGIGGFTASGAPRTLGNALLEKAKDRLKKGENFKINLITGASTSDNIDGELSNLGAVSLRIPYQSNRVMRQHINDEELRYMDLHLSHVPSMIEHGLFGPIDYAFIEASEVTEDGKIFLTTAVGMAPKLCQLAQKIIIEINRKITSSLNGLHDIYSIALPPNTKPLPLTQASQRIGEEYIRVNPEKIVGIVEGNLPMEFCRLAAAEVEANMIGENVTRFILNEVHSKRLPKNLLPVQLGVGNVANALLERFLKEEEIPICEIYSEILQNNAIYGVFSGKIKFASGCALAVDEMCFEKIQQNWDFIKKHVLLRPVEITNHPEIIRRLGIISINTALEVDLWGNVNSTHVCGQKIMNGIGGSGDFTRNAALNIFATPSVAKSGAISSVVPMCSHVDHTEHDVHVLVTEYGVADLRGKPPRERARLIIDHCAHPMYREQLASCISPSSLHTPIDLKRALSFHENFLKKGSML